MNIHNIGFEIKDLKSNGTFSGYGSVYNVIDQGDDIVASGAFTDSLAELSAKGRMPAMLWQHNSADPCGVYTAMREDEIGLYVEGKLALKTQRGAEAYELMQMKAISGLSIGFMTREDSYDQKTGVRTIKKGDLWEVSLVTFPCNDSARINTVKNIEEVTDLKSAERYLRDSCGLSRSAAVAFMSRLNGLKQSDSAKDTEAKQLIDLLSDRYAILKA
ncbi:MULTISPECIES: HK97 family phage prohead protease [Polynucleobacter]|uniref:Proheadase_HK97, phage prohead protease, HK97 family n=1 Tax=uncultured Caudovirales phage TaxID=2100421 RepID=A0A6J5KM51_9CAUD|nr:MULTISPECIES: HK97 family phage prohead protease [Polynucleobacter]QWD55198.1 HK97 family phage prohead protease [Polynucleobacter paneuropaeus]QWE17307.1 HK97 family phage prohead protease [Polynucleobacter sp. AP-Nino-20-G2]CAB4121360.1 proheadase_HK97, phage prohead protease, HK97 family [uncultured Caudovirales phage]